MKSVHVKKSTETKTFCHELKMRIQNENEMKKKTQMVINEIAHVEKKEQRIQIIQMDRVYTVHLKSYLRLK